MANFTNSLSQSFKLKKLWRRINKSVIWGFAAAIVIVLLMAVVAMTAIALVPPATQQQPSPLQHFSAILAPVTAGAAFLGVLVSIFSINANLRLARETQQAARFQKASELISDDLQTAEVAGISLFKQLVDEDWRLFSEPTLTVLKAFIVESVPAGLEGRLTREHMGHAFPRTRVGIIQAVRLINSIHGKRLKRQRTRGNAAAARTNEVIYGLYLSRWNREALVIRDLDFRQVIASYWSMKGGAIAECQVEGRVGRKVRLTGTRLNGTRFKLKRIDEDDLMPWHTDIVQFDACEFDERTTINEYSMKDWMELAASRPHDAPPSSSAEGGAGQKDDHRNDDGFED